MSVTVLQKLRNIFRKSKKRSLNNYLNENYKNKLYTLINLYSENTEIYELKNYLSYYDGPLNDDIKQKIKKVSRFMQNTEMPALDQAIQIIARIKMLTSEDNQLKLSPKTILFLKKQMSELSSESVLEDAHSCFRQEILALEANDLRSFAKTHYIEKRLQNGLYSQMLRHGIAKTKNINPKICVFALLAFSALLTIKTVCDINEKEIDSKNEYIAGRTQLMNLIIESNKNAEDIYHEKEIADEILRLKYDSERNYKEDSKLLNHNDFAAEGKNALMKYLQTLKKDIATYDEFLKHPDIHKKKMFASINKTRDTLIEYFSAKGYRERLTKGLQSEELAKQYQTNIITSLKTIRITITSKAEMNHITTGYACYISKEHRIYVPVDLDSEKFNSDAIVHELLHGAYMSFVNIPMKDRELLENSFRNISHSDIMSNAEKMPNEFRQEIAKQDSTANAYLKDGGERIVRKKMLDFDMAKLGIKKQGEIFTMRHYLELIKRMNELSDDSIEFIQTTKSPEDLILLMNNIAQSSGNPNQDDIRRA